MVGRRPVVSWWREDSSNKRKPRPHCFPWAVTSIVHGSPTCRSLQQGSGISMTDVREWNRGLENCAKTLRCARSPPHRSPPTRSTWRSLAANDAVGILRRDRKSTRLNSSHLVISYAVFCLKKKKKKHRHDDTISNA